MNLLPPELRERLRDRCQSRPPSKGFRTLGAACRAAVGFASECLDWVTGCNRGDVGIATGLPRIADDFLQRPSPRPRERAFLCQAS
jgi:hypothetical protein